MNVKVRETSHSGQAYPDRQDLCVCARVGLSVRGVHIESCIPGEPNYLSISLTGPLRETDRAGERREIGKRIRNKEQKEGKGAVEPILQQSPIAPSVVI